MNPGKFNPESIKRIMAEATRLSEQRTSLVAAIEEYNARASSLNKQFQQWSHTIGMQLQGLAQLELPSKCGVPTSAPSGDSSLIVVPRKKQKVSTSVFYDDPIPEEALDDDWNGETDLSNLNSSSSSEASTSAFALAPAHAPVPAPKSKGRKPGSKNFAGPSNAGRKQLAGPSNADAKNLGGTSNAKKGKKYGLRSVNGKFFKGPENNKDKIDNDDDNDEIMDDA